MNSPFLYLEATLDYVEDSSGLRGNFPARVILNRDAEITSFLIPLGDVGPIHAVTIVDEETGDEAAGSIVEVKRAYDGRDCLLTIKTIAEFLE